MANEWHRRNKNAQVRLGGLPLRVLQLVALLLLGAQEASCIQEVRSVSSVRTQEIQSAPSGSNNNAAESESYGPVVVSTRDDHRRRAPSSTFNLPLGKHESSASGAVVVYPNSYIVIDDTTDTPGLDDLWATRRARLLAVAAATEAEAAVAAAAASTPNVPNAAATEAAASTPDGTTAGAAEAAASSLNVPSTAAAVAAASTPDVTNTAEAAAAAAGVVVDSSSRAQRSLRTCTAGDDFRLSSTVYASANGCYSETGSDTDAYMNAESDRIVVPAHISASSSGAEVFAWVAGEALGDSGDNSPVVNPACVSDEIWAVDSHPADVKSWSCLIDGALVSFSAESFGAECRCPKDSSSSAESTPTPASSETASSSSSETGSSSTTTAADSSTAEGFGCDADSIVVTLPRLDEFGGCFKDEAEEAGTFFFSQAVEHVGGVEAVFPAFFDQNGQDVRWVAGAPSNSSADSRAVPVCLSTNNISSAHPAESTWLCDFNSTGAYVPVLQENFQVDCGCNSTTSSEAPTPSLGVDSRENTMITSSPLGENAAGNGNPSPAPSFAPFAVDRLGTSGGAPGASVDVSVVVVVGLGTVVGFVHRLVGGW